MYYFLVYYHRLSNKYGDVLTTGQVANICNVAPRTVSKWFDSGQLRGYRIPGSRDRRIPMRHLLRFMKKNGIPINAIDEMADDSIAQDSSIQIARFSDRNSAEMAVQEMNLAESQYGILEGNMVKSFSEQE